MKKGKVNAAVESLEGEEDGDACRPLNGRWP